MVATVVAVLVVLAIFVSAMARGQIDKEDYQRWLELVGRP